MRPALSYWAPAVIVACVVLVLSLLPDSGGPDLGWDKANHLAAYAALSFLLTRAMSAGRRVTLRTACLSVAAVFLFGVAVEFLQSLTETRRAEALDAAANAVGAVLGAAAVAVVKNRQEVKGCS